MKGFLKAWWPPIAWAFFIFVVTTLRAPYRFVRTDLPLDKLVHFFLYAGLGYLVTRALRVSGHATVKAAALGLLGTLLFAAVDELHQRWIPTRAPMLGDWVADAIGLLVGTGLGVAVLLVVQARERSRATGTTT